MADLTLIIPSEKGKENPSFVESVKGLLRKISTRFGKPKPGNQIKEIELYDNVKVFILTLPYSTSELLRMKKRRIENLASSFSLNCRDTTLIFAESLSPIFSDVEDEYNFSGGRFIFRALLNAILEEVYRKSGVDIETLNITIIKGDDNGEFFSIIEFFSPVARYINLISENKDEVLKKADEIFENTGLCMDVTSNPSNIIKNTDLVINFDNNWDRIGRFIKKPDTLVINFALQRICRVPRGNTVINGVHITMPQGKLHSIGGDICGKFNNSRLAEAVLFHKMGKPHIERADFVNESLLVKAVNEFGDHGFGIAEFVGPYGSIKLPAEGKSASVDGYLHFLTMGAG